MEIQTNSKKGHSPPKEASFHAEHSQPSLPPSKRQNTLQESQATKSAAQKVPQVKEIAQIAKSAEFVEEGSEHASTHAKKSDPQFLNTQKLKMLLTR